MAENKKSFVLYSDLLSTVEKLPMEQRGVLFTTILQYVNDLNPAVDDLLVDLVFDQVKKQLKRDLVKYEDRAERSRINGKKGGRPSNTETQNNPKKPTGLNANPEKPRKPDTVTDTVTVTVTVTDTVTDTDIKTKADFYFNDPELNFTFLEFIEHRKQIKAKMSDLGITKLKNKLSKLEPSNAVNQLNQSIENGWKGVFEIKELNQNGKTTEKQSRAKSALENIDKGGNDFLNEITGIGSYGNR